LGLFAGADLAEGSFVGEYVGLVRTHANNAVRGGGRHDPYGLHYPSAHPDGTEISAAAFGNVIRCINHVAAPLANAAFVCVNHRGMLRVVCLSSGGGSGGGVARGAQLLVDYGANYWLAAGARPFEGL
ncbi:unnamed protein product, partial [Phaeothamnion confervicola]